MQEGNEYRAEKSARLARSEARCHSRNEDSMYRRHDVRAMFRNPRQVDATILSDGVNVEYKHPRNVSLILRFNISLERISNLICKNSWN